MMPPTIEGFIVSTGGAVRLNIDSQDTDYTLIRDNVSLSTQSVLYSGVNNTSVFLDIGDGFTTNVSYLPSGIYSYTVLDSYGTSSTPNVIPTVYLTVFPENLDIVFIKLMKAALDALVVPEGFAKAQVYHAMPLGGFPPLPAIVIQQELLRQAEIPIGQQVDQEKDDMSMLAIATRRYSVAILSRNSDERDFYRTAIVGCFEAICLDVLSHLGNNIRHSFAVDSSMESTDDPNAAPGFYYADCLFTFDGNFFVGINKQYPIIENTGITITASVSTSKPLSTQGVYSDTTAVATL
jgi:hypothetical protein